MTGTRDAYHYGVDDDIGELPTDLKEDAVPVHPLAFDWAIYAHHLREADLTGEQQRQLIETLWTIATLFVDYGFGVHPVQQACGSQSCGEEADLAALIAEDMVDWNEQPEDFDDEKSGAPKVSLPERNPR